MLIDLKASKITRQDVGQMDMYVRMNDDLRRNEGDGPTLGIVLRAETDEDITRYSVMHGSEQLGAGEMTLDEYRHWKDTYLSRARTTRATIRYGYPGAPDWFRNAGWTCPQKAGCPPLRAARCRDVLGFKPKPCF